MPSQPSRSSTQTARHDRHHTAAGLASSSPYPAHQNHPPQGQLFAEPALTTTLSALYLPRATPHPHPQPQPHPPLPPLRSLSTDLFPDSVSLPHLLARYQLLFPGLDNHTPVPPLSTLTALPPRLAAFARQPHSQRPDHNLPFGFRVRRRRPSSPTAATPSLDEIGHSLENANSHMRALLDTPSQADALLNQIPSSLSSLPDYTAMASRPSGGTGSRRESSRSDESGRLIKRRRLDADRTGPPAYKGFRYGRYGQVEPGDLTMEIVSCDGGLYLDETSYAAENILKNDNTVYCTKGNRCNIVLQHQGCTTFSLKELIIRAPGRNYSSPVREGMVFLSMSKDELLRTEQYQSSMNPRSASFLHHMDAQRQRPSQRARLGRAAASDMHGHDENVDADYLQEIHNLALDGADETPSAAPAELVQVTDPPTFYVMTECSDDDEATGRGGRERDGRGTGWRSAAGWSPTPLGNRSRIRRRLLVDEESSPIDEEASPFGANLVSEDEDDDDDYTELYDLGDATLSSPDSPPADDGGGRVPARARTDRDHTHAHSRGRRGRGQGEAASSVFHAAHFFEGGDSGQSGHGTPTALPNAEFHIEKNKNKCTIHFNPPVTARYILLKMWNPHQNPSENIDIQGVVAKGFAGPRYFPSLELR